MNIKTAREQFKNWNEALQTGDAERVAFLYHSTNISFLPTLSNELVTTISGVTNYFVHFLQKKPAGKIIEEKFQVLNSGLFTPWRYCYSGKYDFEIGPEGNREVVHARFTYIYEFKWWVSNKRKKGWKIIHHHWC